MEDLTSTMPDMIDNFFNYFNEEGIQYDTAKLFSIALKKYNAILAGESVYGLMAGGHYENVKTLDIYVNIENASDFVLSMVSYSACYDMHLDKAYNMNNLVDDDVPTLRNKIFEITHDYNPNGTLFSMYNKIYGSLKIKQKYITPIEMTVYFVENGVNLLDIVKNIEITTFRVCYDGERILSFANIVYDVFDTDMYFFNTPAWLKRQQKTISDTLMTKYTVVVKKAEALKEDLTKEECEEFAIRLLYSKVICFLRFVEKEYAENLKKVCRNPLEDFTLDGLLENIRTIFNEDDRKINDRELVHMLCQQTLSGYNDRSEKFNPRYYIKDFPYSESQKNIDSQEYIPIGILKAIEKIKEEVSVFSDSLSVNDYLENCYMYTFKNFNHNVVDEINQVRLSSNEQCLTSINGLLNIKSAIQKAVDIGIFITVELFLEYNKLENDCKTAEYFYGRMGNVFPEMNSVLRINTREEERDEFSTMDRALYHDCLPIMQNSLDSILMISLICDMFSKATIKMSEVYAKTIEYNSSKSKIKNIHGIDIANIGMSSIKCDVNDEVRVCFDPVNFGDDTLIQTHLQNYIMFVYKIGEGNFKSTCYSRKLLKKYYYDLFNWYYVCNPDSGIFKDKVYVKISGVIGGGHAYVHINQLTALLITNTRGKVFYLKPINAEGVKESGDVYNVSHNNVVGKSWHLVNLEHADAVSAKHCTPDDSLEIYDISYCQKGSVRVKFPSVELWSELDNFLRKNPDERVTEVTELGNEFDKDDYEDEEYDEALDNEYIERENIDDDFFTVKQELFKSVDRDNTVDVASEHSDDDGDSENDDWLQHGDDGDDGDDGWLQRASDAESESETESERERRINEMML